MEPPWESVGTPVGGFNQELYKKYRKIIPLDWKFYGEFDSDNQNIDLYKKQLILMKNRGQNGGLRGLL